MERAARGRLCASCRRFPPVDPGEEGDAPMNLTMQSVYLACAAAGGTVLVIQTVLLIFGGGDHDAAGAGSDHPEIGHSDSGEHGAHDGALNLMSIRGVAAFLTFFGLAGWGGTS